VTITELETTLDGREWFTVRFISLLPIPTKNIWLVTSVNFVIASFTTRARAERYLAKVLRDLGKLGTVISLISSFGSANALPRITETRRKVVKSRNGRD